MHVQSAEKTPLAEDHTSDADACQTHSRSSAVPTALSNSESRARLFNEAAMREASTILSDFIENGFDYNFETNKKWLSIEL